jgi:aminobenzoyl-glutamate utilization protein B
VPEHAEVVLMARHPDKGMLAGIWERILTCAQAGATAAGTQVSFEVTGSYANMLSNRAITSAIDRNLRRVGGYRYSPEEQAFAEKIRKSFSPEPPLAIGTQEKPLPVQEGVLSGSTDVGDVSWNVPTSQMLAATWVPGTPAHTWQSTAASGMSIGEKGMMVAAKTLALTAIDLVTDAKLLGEAKAEFQKGTAGKTYTTMHPAAVRLR